MEPINGINIEKYAELCAKMNDVFKDKEACARIAESEGISRENWAAAHKGWQSRITNPADMGVTESRFVSSWKTAMDKMKSLKSNNK
jgi:hypothetical protein